MSIDEAAKRADLRPDQISAWETGEDRLSIPQLRRLARVYRRPLAAFHLPEPPEEPPLIHDFRRATDRIGRRDSPELRFEVRRARCRREIALELYERLAMRPPDFRDTASLDEDPEALGARVRQILGIAEDVHKRWRSEYDALSAWRELLHSAGVLVFQAFEMPRKEVRAFSVSEYPLPAIVLNNKDAPQGRIFSLLHEFVHLLLRQGGICDLEEEGRHGHQDQAIESFCNHVAGAALLPKEFVLRDEVVLRHGDSAKWSDQEINKLAGEYRVSRDVVVRRLLILGRTNQRFYQDKQHEYEAQYEAKRIKDKDDRSALRERLVEQGESPGFQSPSRTVVLGAGRLFVGLVLESLCRESITLSDVCDYLGTRLKHLHKIENELLRQVAGGASER